MTRKPKRIRGTQLFSLLGRACLAVQKHGLWACGVHYFWRWLSGSLARKAFAFFGFAWKARLVWYWRWSPSVSEDEYVARDAVCMSCERQKLKPPPVGFWGRAFAWLFPGGRFCQQCGCSDNRWAELTVKNTREGHFCPMHKHPGQPPMPAMKSAGCKGCGSKKKENGKDTGKPEVPATIERAALPALNRS